MSAFAAIVSSKIPTLFDFVKEQFLIPTHMYRMMWSGKNGPRYAGKFKNYFKAEGKGYITSETLLEEFGKDIVFV